MSDAASSEAQRGRFPTTRWSSVIHPIALDAPEAAQAWERLCIDYWLPVYSYLRSWGYDTHLAEDLTQEFFEHIFVKELPKGADQNRGRFRNYLLTTLKFFLANRHAKNTAQKRGGGRPLESLEGAEEKFGLLSDQAGADPERAFHLQFLYKLLERAHHRLKEEYRQRGEDRIFEKLLETGDYNVSPEDVADELGITVGAIYARKSRMIRRRRELFRSELAKLVPPEEIDEELRFLRNLVL